MTTQVLTRRRRLPLVLLASFAVLAATPIALQAHAELDTAAPADGSTVQAPFAGPIVMTFTEALSSGSGAELLDNAGSVGASTTIDGPTMTLTPDAPLAAGVFEVRWTSIADDGHVERGTVRFTVADAATTEPTASAAPGSGSSGDAASGTDVVLPIIVGALLVGALAIVLLRRRDSTSTPS